MYKPVIRENSGYYQQYENFKHDGKVEGDRWRSAVMVTADCVVTADACYMWMVAAV